MHLCRTKNSNVQVSEQKHEKIRKNTNYKIHLSVESPEGLELELGGMNNSEKFSTLFDLIKSITSFNFNNSLSILCDFNVDK